MATNVTYNGVTYSVPQNGNSGWGTQLTAYLVALASGSLTKAGGVVTLTANLDLGANYGIKSIFFSDRGTAASAGIVRLSNNTAVSWRNAANDANLDLLVNASNNLTWKNTFKIQNTSAGFSALAHDTQGLELQSTLMNATSKYCPPIKFMCADTDIATNNPRCIAYIAARTPGTVNSDTTAWGILEFATLPGGEAAATMPTIRATIDQNGNFGVANLAGSGSRLVRASAAGNLSATAADIVNADISASAAIAYSKLNLATSIVNADVSGSAAIAYSKLNLGTSIVNADINGSAAIAYSKLNLSTSIVNADISASAAIDGSKLVAASASVAGAMTTGTQTIAGAKTFTETLVLNNGAKMDDDADQDALTYYRTEEVSLDWIFNGSGPGAAAPFAVRLTRIGNVVHFHTGVPRNTTGTTSTILSSTALPAWARPVRRPLLKGCYIRNNGAADATSIGIFDIETTGVISIYRDLSLTAFTNATNCGLQNSFSGSFAIE